MDKTFEKIVAVIIGILILLIAGIAVLEDWSGPKVNSVNMPDFVENNQAGIKIEFSELMNRKSVESNLKIEPALPFKFYWQGKKLILNPMEAWQTAMNYKLIIPNLVEDERGRKISADYVKEFQTPKTEVIYIGTDGEEKNRIIIRDLDGGKVKEYLDGNLLIKKFLINQKDQELILLAKDLKSSVNFEIFSLNLQSGELKNLFVADNYQNIDINFSRTSEYLMVGRIQVDNGQYISKNQLWLSRKENGKWEDLLKINGAYGAKGIFSPNDAYVIAMDEQENFQLIDLKDLNAEKQFIGKFKKAWDFHPSKALILLDKFVDQLSLKSQLILFDGNGQMEVLNLPTGVVSLAKFSNDGKYIWIFLNEQTEVEAQLNAGKSSVYKYDWLMKKLEKVEESELVNFDEGDWSIDNKYLLLEKIDKLESESLGAKYRNIEIDLDGEARGVDMAIMDLNNGEIKDFDWKGYNLKFIYE